MSTITLIGEFTRQQWKLVMILLSRFVGFMANPSPTSIERVRHTLSATFLTGLAAALRSSAQGWDTRAPSKPFGAGRRTLAAIKADLSITRRQRHMLIDIYEAFQKENHATAAQARQARVRSSRPSTAPVHRPNGHAVPDTRNGRT
ncbi:transcriptional regulator [Nonomuraea basaltis]|uniref:transcriptional regulator n=1 Tax=Nonomuraea basaltis TaxID=2495887 RepID=UPI00110C70DA|nr:transcriptional regulator [Nonomuraea basaltis]TMR88912.1 transcriptional regulator [Nonomuraea basaltis]